MHIGNLIPVIGSWLQGASAGASAAALTCLSPQFRLVYAACIAKHAVVIKRLRQTIRLRARAMALSSKCVCVCSMLIVHVPYACCVHAVRVSAYLLVMCTEKYAMKLGAMCQDT